MQTTNQPQTTNNSEDRDASVQILENDDHKCFQIIEGVMKTHGSNRLERANPENSGKCSDALLDLAQLLAWLTSSDKTSREYAKKEVRKLVKIGQEAQA